MKCRACTTKLRDDGTCPFKCNPAFARPYARYRDRARQGAPVESTVTRSDCQRVTARIVAIDPLYAQLSAKQRARRTG